jgi:AraC-like DNA-binding protein
MMPSRTRGRFQESTEGVRLIAGVERIGLCGRFAEVSRHRHAAPALVIGVDGPLRFVAERMHESRAVLIEPGFTHAVDTRGGRLAMFVLPPHARASARRGGPGAPRGGENSPPLRDLAEPGRWVELGEAVFRQELTDFAEIDHALAREGLDLQPLDDRLRIALHVLAETLEDNVSIDDVASSARLSASRLMALAHAQLGASLRAYRRWLRAFQVARDYAGGASLTEAAMAAGFSSSAHLSAAARDHFGIRPSDILTPHNRPAIRAL